MVTGTGLQVDGSYTCIFTSDGVDYPSSGEVNVRKVTVSGRSEPADSPQNDVTIVSHLNGDLGLVCSLVVPTGTTSTVTWTGPTDEDLASKTTDTLTLTDPSSDVNGAYTCTYSFNDGPTVQGTFNVQVSIVEMKSPSNLYALYGNTLVHELVCELESAAQENLKFYMAGAEVELADTTVTFVAGKTTAKYNIAIDSKESGGTYECKLSDTEFSRTDSVLVVFGSLEELPEESWGSEQVTLVCSFSTSEDIVTTIKWYINVEGGSETVASEVAEDVFADDGSSLTSTLTVDVAASNNNGATFRCEVEYNSLTSGATTIESSTIVRMSG